MIYNCCGNNARGFSSEFELSKKKTKGNSPVRQSRENKSCNHYANSIIAK